MKLTTSWRTFKTFVMKALLLIALTTLLLAAATLILEAITSASLCKPYP
jgi:hypothetical protein